MIQSWIVIAGEESGPESNKLGGIWNVIYAEAKMLAQLISSGEIDPNLKLIVAGPYYPKVGSDWHKGKSRVTDLSGFERLDMGPELDSVLAQLKAGGVEVVSAQKTFNDVPVGYLLFNTDYYESAVTSRYGTDMTLNSAIKREAWELINLDSMNFERMQSGGEYTHYLGLSYAVSELVRVLLRQSEAPAEKYKDEAVSDFARSVLPKARVSLHCHEFGVFYALARVRSLGLPVRTVATLHATVPGRTAGYLSLKKIAQNDKTWAPGTSVAFAALESLAKYADVVTFVGDSTLKEALLFYGIRGIVIRNGIELEADGIDWVKKERCRSRIQQFVSDNLYKLFGGERIPLENILPIFTISRIEIENKGYPQLLDALMLHDHLIKNRIMGQRFADKFRVVCFLITAHGPKPKDRLPEGFPLNLTPEILVWEENRLQNMILDRGLDLKQLISGDRMVAAALYPQWVGKDDGGLGMTADEIMAGCIAGIFPSQYDPFLLTGLEAGSVGTPSIVSRTCGFSDALKKVKHLVKGMGGVVIVDNIESTPIEAALDYALAMDYFTWTYVDDQVKYRLLCEESFSLTKLMNWQEPVLEYLNNLIVSK